MAAAHPEEHVALPVAHQDWHDVAFVHWRYDPDEVARVLPPPLVPDVFDGSAWVSLTPFRVRRFRAGMGPALPGLSDFPETNVRTYVRGPDGRDGLWFLSLDVASAPNTLAGRAMGVPYFWSAMTVRRHDGDVVEYLCRRRGDVDAAHHVRVRAGAPLSPQPELDTWLTGRWRAYALLAGRLLQVAVEHEPWPLREAELVDLDESLVVTAGLPQPGEPALVRFADGPLHARLGRPRVVGAAERVTAGV